MRVTLLEWLCGIAAAVVTVGVAACRPAVSPASVALTHVAVVDVESGAVWRDRTVLIDGGTIRQVAAAADALAAIGPATTIVEGSGRYAIPGLWDMHVHFRTGPASNVPREVLVESNRALLPQYIGFGVTGVRDCGGDLPDEVLAWRREIAANTLIGPRIFTSLRKIDGPPPADVDAEVSTQGAIAVGSPDEAAAAVDSLVAAGADFLKLNDYWIDEASYFAALDAAKARGIPTAGHVPYQIPLEDVIAAGIGSIEHDDHLLKAAFPDDRAFSADLARAIAAGRVEPFYDMLARLAAAADIAHARVALRQMAHRAVALTPTALMVQIVSVVDPAEHEHDTRLAQLPPAIRASFAQRIDDASFRSAEQVADHVHAAAVARDLVGIAAEEGVTILAGTDTGAGNSYMYPGFTLHAELRELVAAGLTPLQALQAATIRAAEWFGAADRFGTIAEGRAADLVLLDDNPIEDIARTEDIAGVILNGVYFDAAALDRLRTLDAAVR
jgi:imidazolonepropionase-like amidohydrolase